MNIKEIVIKAKKNLAMITNLEFNGVIGVSKESNEWKITAELIERKSIPDTSDVLGIYEIKLTDEGEIVAFNRIKLRRRGDTQEGLKEGL